MPENYLIGVDIGTQGTKTSLFDTEGDTIAEAFEASRLISPSPGVVEQDADEIYSSVLRTIKEVMEKSGADPRKIAAVGMDGQMAGIMGIDEDWTAVTRYDSWLDTRCGKYIGMIKQRAEEAVIGTQAVRSPMPMAPRCFGGCMKGRKNIKRSVNLSCRLRMLPAK